MGQLDNRIFHFRLTALQLKTRRKLLRFFFSSLIFFPPLLNKSLIVLWLFQDTFSVSDWPLWNVSTLPDTSPGQQPWEQPPPGQLPFPPAPLLSLGLWKGNTHFLSIHLQETARPQQPVPNSFHPFFKTFKQRQSVLLWPAAVLACSGLGLSSLELVGSNWNYSPSPHRWALQPLASQTLLVVPRTEHFVVFKCREAPRDFSSCKDET